MRSRNGASRRSVRRLVAFTPLSEVRDAAEVRELLVEHFDWPGG